MPKPRLKKDDNGLASNKQEVKVQGPKALGEKVLLHLGLEGKDSADLWIYKDSRGGLYITQEPRNWPQMQEFR